MSLDDFVLFINQQNLGTLKLHSLVNSPNIVCNQCSQTLLVYLFIRFAHISYGRFIAVRYKFKLSTYILELLAIVGVDYRERFKWENG
jgi:hypothetical protein